MTIRTKKNATISVSVDGGLRERLEALASRLNRSRDGLVGDAVASFVALQEWQLAGIDTAVNSLDADRAVDHDDVVSWISSWGTDEELPKPRV